MVFDRPKNGCGKHSKNTGFPARKFGFGTVSRKFKPTALFYPPKTNPMQKTFLLGLFGLFLFVAPVKAQTDDEERDGKIKTALGYLVSGHILGGYTSIVYTADALNSAGGTYKDSATYHLAYNVAVLNGVIDVLKDLNEIDFLDETDQQFVISAVATIRELVNMGNAYLAPLQKNEKPDQHKYNQYRASSRKKIMDLLEIADGTLL